ncbi:glyoxylate/hydroxypyruvate reductase A [Acidisphaera sp. L21]|uniref:2-hydroxyacid dehydrogenase n=1 Tax=Acidisphaera sp. L21 TaxID=1641851 RepID=UPI00131EB9F5|nr:glyoxylate/hydroxypyruvate reductase A [Acidisphaera sp. L21]
MAVLCLLHRAYGDDLMNGIRAGLPGEDIREWPDVRDPADIDICVIFRMQPGFLAPYPNLRLISSTGAGIDHYLSDPSLPRDIPLVRVVDPDSGARMAEYTLCWVLFHHRDVAFFQAAQARGEWAYKQMRSASSVRVGVMGLGHMGASACERLVATGYQVAGWSRGPKSLPGVENFHGPNGFEAFLARTEILVNLLPLTAETKGILCRRTFDAMPRGSVVISAGRGAHLLEADLQAALADGQLRAATIDAFPKEPLPADSPLWTTPNLHITPHCSSTASLETTVGVITGNIRRFRAGEPLLNLVDYSKGY